ncbi:protein phosphatase 2C domain-containing protein [Kovacikia minuta CCNUW1]|uniref:protein phosphatase 2C domain-containing protein n=1 Tax=Kovacikia minuta TaxID=2931930 RepID=UPI001CCBCF5D|nr:protein phosphatase 2C domain-containing protein [Kovacikia minuta]UBF24799.1 protein phosphatase 2C domain-containing protein [Kovacikia minuta CCNUW1]
MHNDPVTIYCPNPLCQAPNPESHRFCYQCRTPLPKRYLWVAGKVESLRPGELLADRYWVKRDRIVLDTKPGLLPDSPDEISETIEAYLRLSPYQPHVPQIYGSIRLRQGISAVDVLLLEQAPIYPEGIVPSPSSDSLEGQLMPELASVWKGSSALRQLHWLWQIAQLWQPLSIQNVASTVLRPELLRTEGGTLRLLELRTDGKKNPSLADLAEVWQHWRSAAQPLIADFLAKLVQQMQQGQIKSAEQVVAVLDQALAVCGQTQSRQIQIVTQTDQGPSRQRNEDACYPPSGSVLAIANPGRGGTGSATGTAGSFSASPIAAPLVVVCDGIGGHEGGDVASSSAIAVIQQKLQRISLPTTHPDVLVAQLEQAVLAANDVISQRNDSESRQERQRMGTTLVMALIHGHELYLAHVGDSRAYQITRTGCHQVTMDDDLASRETRLGYSLYREALQQQGSGSLVQALGMGPSNLLHPTVQRFVLDEDCLFLLCSDGLSDNDRVEEYWQTELLPVVEGKVDVAVAAQRLVVIANSQNGHDNVTVGLIYCRVSPGDRSLRSAPLDVSLATPPPLANRVMGTDPEEDSSYVAPPTFRTQIVKQRDTSNPFFKTLGIGTVLVMAGVLAYFLALRLRPESTAPTALQSPSPEPSASVPTPPSPPVASSQSLLTVGTLVQVNRSTPPGDPQANSIALLTEPTGATASPGTAIADVIPVGTTLQVIRKQELPTRGTWLQLKVCSAPGQKAAITQTVQPGQIGWVEEAAIAPLVVQETALTPGQLGSCGNTPSSSEERIEPR